MKIPVEVRPSKVHGRGLFTTRGFILGELITKTPAIWVPKHEVPEGHTLWPYTFDHEDSFLIGLGDVSFVNYSDYPNAEIIYNTPTQEIFLNATKIIYGGDEVFIRYTGADLRKVLGNPRT